MKIPYFHVDAFAREPFRGNPAGVCLLEQWLPDELMRKIALENRHSETAFVVEASGTFHLRWFTPVKEVQLCGHATLAAAFVVFERLGYTEPVLGFETASGTLKVARDGSLFVLDLPVRPTDPCETSETLIRAVGRHPVETRRARAYLAVLASETEVKELQPDLKAVEELDAAGLIVTAPGDEVDFVSRYFAPKLGVPEDPVTGSAHCALIPYWAHRFGRTKLQARQLSARGGDLRCELWKDRVKIGGSAVGYLSGTIEVDAHG
mgnify:CR=1 FL=1